MNIDLLFHICNKEEWKVYSKSGYVEPESLINDGFIHLSTGEQIEAVANDLYNGCEDCILLVIDPLRLQVPVKLERAENGNKYPHAYGKIALDSVIDKLPLSPDSKGRFEIRVKHFD
jgi:uncharacterized protein (DUF952 family)